MFQISYSSIFSSSSQYFWSINLVFIFNYSLLVLLNICCFCFLSQICTLISLIIIIIDARWNQIYFFFHEHGLARRQRVLFFMLIPIQLTIDISFANSLKKPLNEFSFVFNSFEENLFWVANHLLKFNNSNVICKTY